MSDYAFISRQLGRVPYRLSIFFLLTLSLCCRKLVRQAQFPKPDHRIGVTSSTPISNNFFKQSLFHLYDLFRPNGPSRSKMFQLRFQHSNYNDVMLGIGASYYLIVFIIVFLFQTSDDGSLKSIRPFSYLNILVLGY